MPPAPLAAVHPELEALLDQTIKQFKRSWLNGSESVDLAVSPPWGSAWLLPTGNLPEEEVEEQVVWELQQRLDNPLDRYIYAWHPLEEQAYAIVIRPELLAFWDRLADSNSLQVGTVTLLAGLVEPAVERSADLMPLYHLWADRKGGAEIDEAAEEDLDSFGTEEEEEIPELEEKGSESYLPESIADDDEADEALRALIGDERKPKRSKRRKSAGNRGVAKRLLPVLIVVVLLGAVASMLIMRDRIPAVGNLLARFTPPERAEEVATPTPAEEIGQDRSITTVTIPRQDIPLPPESPTAGSTLGSMYELADMNNVDLHSLILQGEDIQLEVVGESESIVAWKNAMSGVENSPNLDLLEPAVLSPGTPVQATLAPATEELVTESQFREWVHSLGIEDYGRHAYNADRDALQRLLSVMKGERRRPFRLSIHHATGDRYLLVMFP